MPNPSWCVCHVLIGEEGGGGWEAYLRRSNIIWNLLYFEFFLPILQLKYSPFWYQVYTFLYWSPKGPTHTSWCRFQHDDPTPCHQYHWNATPENKKLFCDSHNHCKKVLKDAMYNYAEATRHSVVSQLIGSRDFFRICNSILNRGKSTIPPLFNGPEVLTSLLTKRTPLLGIFHAIPTLMMVPTAYRFSILYWKET